MKAFTPLHSLRWCAFILAATLEVFSLAATPGGTPTAVSIKSDNPNLFYSGRMQREGDKQVTQGWSGARVCLHFTGTSVALQMTSDTPDNYVLPWVDGQAGEKIRLDSPEGVYPIARDLKPGEHTIEVVRATEC